MRRLYERAKRVQCNAAAADIDWDSKLEGDQRVRDHLHVLRGVFPVPSREPRRRSLLRRLLGGGGSRLAKEGTSGGSRRRRRPAPRTTSICAWIRLVSAVRTQRRRP